MASLSHEARRREALRVLATRAGTDDPAGEAARIESEWGPLGTFQLDVLFGALWSRPLLPARERSLVALSVLVTIGARESMIAEIHAAVENGLQRSAIEEIVTTLSGYAGFPRAFDAFPLVEEAFSQLGAPAPGARDAATRRSDPERDTAAREIAEDMYPDLIDRKEPAVDLGSITGEVLRFAYGELWPRTELSRRERSLVVTTSLTTQGNADEMQAHMRGAGRNGLSDAAIEELLITIAFYAGFPTCVEGFRQWRLVQAARS